MQVNIIIYCVITHSIRGGRITVFCTISICLWRNVVASDVAGVCEQMASLSRKRVIGVSVIRWRMRVDPVRRVLAHRCTVIVRVYRL